MKKYFFILSIAAISALSYSCNTNFSPYAPSTQQYVLNFVIRADTNFQTATLSKSYPATSTNPYSNQADNSVHGAVIRVWQNDQVSILRDTTVPRPQPSSYTSPLSVYYNNNFQMQGSSQVTVEALLPDGTRLTSSSTVPDNVTFNYGSIDTLIPMPNANVVSLYWSTTKSDVVTMPRLSILYYSYTTGSRKLNKFVVPLSYVTVGNQLVANYPKPLTQPGYTVDLATFGQAMQLLSAGDPAKSKYEILIAQIEVFSFDQYLSMYYDSTVRSTDTYLVTLDSPDYTNIKGGLGIFGIYNKTTGIIKISQDYIRSFGYTPALPFF